MARSQGLALPSGNRGLLIIAALAGLAAAVLFVIAASQGDSGSSGTSSVGGTVKVVVAKHDIDAGTRIEAGMLKISDVPQELVVAGAFSDTPGVVGEVTRVAIRENEAITDTKIGPLADAKGVDGVLGDGQQAVGVRVEDVTAVGGLLLPGNHVDIHATFPADHPLLGLYENFADGDPVVVMTILQNVEVISVGQEAQEPTGAGNGNGTADTVTGGTVPDDVKEQPGAATVTVAVSPEQAQILIAVQEEAERVWVTLRAFGDDAPTKVPRSWDISELVGR